jgi:hypothetical protein
MAAQNQKPWWELEGKLHHDGPLDAERERLRSELARAWRWHLGARAGEAPRTSSPSRRAA